MFTVASILKLDLTENKKCLIAYLIKHNELNTFGKSLTILLES